MAGVAEKPYSPILGASIPAFYEENGTAVISVPFSMNRAVSARSVYSFTLKIKTAQSNIYLKSLESDSDSTQTYIGDRVVKFYWTNFNAEEGVNKVKVGQYLKVQLAYNAPVFDANGENIIGHTPGYFSTVAVVKFTSKPKIYIKDMSGLPYNGIPIFKQSYTGVYEVTEDVNERPYAYNFYLYDYKKVLIEESGWQLHNSSVNTTATESLTITEATDTYSFTTGTISGKEYYVQYGVRTINNLEVYSPMYSCIESNEANINLAADLVAINNFEEGYVELQLKHHEDDNEYAINSPISIEISRAEIGNSNYDVLDGFTWRPLKRLYFPEGSTYASIEKLRFKDYLVEQGVTYLYCYQQYNENGVLTRRVRSDPVIADFEDMFLYDGKIQLKIRFNPKVSSFKITRQEQKIDTIGSKFPFIFRNGVVEYKEFPIGGLISYLADNNKEFFKDEEDLNIIRADDASRTVTSVYEETFTLVELTNETYEPNQFYLKYNDKYFPAVCPFFSDYPAGTDFYQQSIRNRDITKPWETTETLDSVGYNMRAERRFKLKLLQWLGDGNIKLFRSPAEGNYLVRLLNISLTPEDKLGRMIHSFQATAYEVEELSYKNLYELGFINVNDYEELRIESKSVYIKDRIDTIDDVESSKKLNDRNIVSILTIQPAANTESTSFIVRIGGDNENRKALIRTGEFSIKAPGELPNIWINLQDNRILSENLNYAFQIQKPLTVSDLDVFPMAFRNQFLQNGALKSGVTVEKIILAAAKDLVGDAVLSYTYQNIAVQSGEIESSDGDNIQNVYIKNVVASLIGPAQLNGSQTITRNNNIIEQHNILQYYALNFKRKDVIPDAVYEYNGIIYKYANHQVEMHAFNTNSLYKKGGDDSNYYYSTNGTSLNRQVARNDDDAKKIILTLSPGENVTENNRVIVFEEAPTVDLRGNLFDSIQIGAFYQLDYACQEKITELLSS